MRSALLKAASLALVCLHAASAVRAGVDVHTVFEDNGHVVVQLDNYYTPSLSPLKYFYVAISHSGAYSVKFYRGAWTPPGKAAPPDASAALDTLTVAPPFEFRGARVLPIIVRIPSSTSVCRVEVTYEPAQALADPATLDPLVRDLVMNRNTVSIQTVAGAPEAWFSRGGGWVKLAVSERGMYAVSGADLSGIGVNAQGIDPATLRVYTQGGIAQPRDLTAPAGSWRPGEAMREVAIRVEDPGNDGTFDPGDRVVFYGVGTRDWADYYDASAPDTLFYEHERALTNYYYLTWGGTLPGTPRRMADVDATPVAATDRTSYTQREYRERDLISDFNFRGDGWLWLDVADKRPYTLASVPVTHLVSSVPQEFFSVGLSPYQSPPDPPSDNANHHVVYKRSLGAQEVVIGEKVWSTQPGENYYENGIPIRLAGSFLGDGDNSIKFQVPRDLNPNDEQLFAWFALRYERRIVATGDAVAFSTPDSTGAVTMRARGFSTSGTLFAFDLTDPWSPSRLTGAGIATAGSERTMRIGFDLAGRRQVWAGTGGAFRKPALTRVTPVELRAEATPPNMLIITHRDMRAAADRLRSYRASHLPGYSAPAVKVVTTDEIYDNFSGGMPDAMGLRNYIKYLFDNYHDAAGNPRIAYVLLLGDANEDFQNHASSQPDFVPSNLYFTRNTVFAYSTDEWFGHLDAQDQVPGYGVLDVALGRLPAASAEEAAFLVDKVIAYETESPRDAWRQRGILVADDENSASSNCETQWPQDSETINLYRAPNFLDIRKIYLTEYPAIAGVKPTSRREFIDAWNAGAMVVNYIGHGSPVQMADEQVFLEADVSQLTNGLRLPVMMAFSCTVGQFASPAGKSLSEKLLLHESGGAIATVTASNETYAFPNQRTCFAMFDGLFPDRPGSEEQRAIGVTVMRAKLFGQIDTHQSFQEENSWKYNLLGDPAMRPATPRNEVRFQAAAPDTLVAGARHALRGAVYNGDVIDTAFDGPVYVSVREPEVRRKYVSASCPGLTILYNLPGGPIYQGTVDAVDGRFEVSFRVPRYASTGTVGYAGAYAQNGVTDAATARDSLFTVMAPTLADSLALKPVDGAPRVDLGFKSGLQVVKPGDTVRARVADADGINILDTTNEGRQAILIDNLPVPIDVNEFFTFDHGGVDTTGTLLYPLPDLAVGKHRLVYKVSDSFGFTTLDTLQFSVTDDANYYAESAFNYPNPFSDSTQFLFRISDRAAIRLELYTISGKFVRRIEETREGGEVWLRWDGRDAGGGDVANGSYLYVATIDFVGVDRPPVVLRGALSRIR